MISLVILGLVSMGVFSISKYVFKGSQKVHASNLMGTLESQILATLSSPNFYNSPAIGGGVIRDRLLDGSLLALNIEFDGGVVIASSATRTLHNVLSGSPCPAATTNDACSVYTDIALRNAGTLADHPNWKIAYRVGARINEGLPLSPLGAQSAGPGFVAADYTFTIPEGFYSEMTGLRCGAGQILDGYSIVGTERVARCLVNPISIGCPPGQYSAGLRKDYSLAPSQATGGALLVGKLELVCRNLPRQKCPAGYGIRSINARKLLAPTPQTPPAVECINLNARVLAVPPEADSFKCPDGYDEVLGPPRVCRIKSERLPALEDAPLPLCEAGKQWMRDTSDALKGKCCNPSTHTKVEGDVCRS